MFQKNPKKAQAILIDCVIRTDVEQDEEIKQLQAQLRLSEQENEKLRELVKELVLSNPALCWRKCWGCGEKQIHRSDVTPGVLCRFCGSQDTRLLKKETEALHSPKETNG
jgi:hypothetical protein